MYLRKRDLLLCSAYCAHFPATIVAGEAYEVIVVLCQGGSVRDRNEG